MLTFTVTVQEVKPGFVCVEYKCVPDNVTKTESGPGGFVQDSIREMVSSISAIMQQSGGVIEMDGPSSIMNGAVESTKKGIADGTFQFPSNGRN